jgi:hypothetical protein
MTSYPLLSPSGRSRTPLTWVDSISCRSYRYQVSNQRADSSYEHGPRTQAGLVPDCYWLQPPHTGRAGCWRTWPREADRPHRSGPGIGFTRTRAT